MGKSVAWLAIGLSLALTGCSAIPANFISEDNRAISFTADRGVSAQPFPANHKAEILAFMRTYLNNPVGLRETAMAEPVQRTIGGRLRYVSCLKFSARDPGGAYRPAGERAIVYVDGRLDRVVEEAGELCAGAAYAPFPELAAITR